VKRRETRAQDNARTGRLLDQSDAAFAHEPDNGLAVEFEAVVMEGLLTDRAAPVYPPPGHTFPRRS
jgi:hypothetical protein